MLNDLLGAVRKAEDDDDEVKTPVQEDLLEHLISPLFCRRTLWQG